MTTNDPIKADAREGVGALSGSRPSDEAASSTASSPSGFDPARRRNVLDFYGLRARDTWEWCFISLGDAEQLSRHKYGAKEDWGHPLAASCWVDEERGNLKLFVADYENGKRVVARHGRNITITYGETPYLERQQLIAIATETRRAETTGSVEDEGASGTDRPNDTTEAP